MSQKVTCNGNCHSTNSLFVLKFLTVNWLTS